MLAMSLDLKELIIINLIIIDLDLFTGRNILFEDEIKEKFLPGIPERAFAFI